MGLRGFGTTTVTGSAQPAFGTTLTAATAQPSPDMFTGNLQPASNRSQLVLAVANPAIFRVGDKVNVGAVADFAQTSTTTPDNGTVSAVNVAGSKITVVGLLRAHASGDFVVLSLQAARIKIIYTGAAVLYIGGDSSVASNSKTLADALIATGTAYDIGISTPGDVYGTGDIWVNGTANDTFLPSIVTI